MQIEKVNEFKNNSQIRKNLISNMIIDLKKFVKEVPEVEKVCEFEKTFKNVQFFEKIMELKKMELKKYS